MDFVWTIIWDVMKFVGEPAFYGGVGLLVGWNVLPQPKFIKAGWDKAVPVVKKFWAAIKAKCQE